MLRSSKKRVVLFKAISILVPFLVLFLLEISLRIFHYGHNSNLFIEYGSDKNFLVLNPDASKKYFTNQEIATTGNIELFKKEKDGNTLRIFVLGESTTIGYPYFHNGSFHRWLQYRLMHTFPDKNFEIINLSLTAVNSYTVLGFAKEVVNYEPDAILIYAGHNEYYGALGVGSTDKIGGSPYMVNLILRLRQLRLTQMMTNLYEKIVRSFGAGKARSRKTRMEMMVADQQIPFQSKLFNRGIDQFKSNMDEALNLFNKVHIPVFISNLVSNEKDLTPFISVEADSLQFPGFKLNYELGVKAFENKDLQAAYTYFEAANKLYNAHAICNYYLGRVAYLQGDFQRAKVYFSKAKELDALRFRAPDQINEIISQLCDKYKNAHMADTKTAFEAYSNNQIIGNELLLEHVHPNLTGYALISDVFYETMKKEGLFSLNNQKEMPFKQLLQDMPITKVDSLTGIYKAFNLKKSWPFTQAQLQDSLTVESEEEKLAYNIAFKRLRWQEAMDDLYGYYIKSEDLAKARNVMETLVLEHPTDASFYEKAAMLCGELKDHEEAVFYFKKTFSLSPSFNIAKYLFVIYLKLDKPAEAIPYLDYAIHHNVSGLNLVPIKQFAGEIIRMQNAYAKDSSDISILNQIADKYFRMGNKEGASKYLEKALKADPKNKEALSQYRELKK